MKRNILRFSAITMATASIGLGIAAASSASIDTTGPDSINKVEVSAHNSVELKNKNNLGVGAKHSAREYLPPIAVICHLVPTQFELPQDQFQYILKWQ